MKRRDFVTLMGSAPFFAMVPASFSGKYSGDNSLANTTQLVNTPQKRMAYTWKLLNKLCTNIGPRPTGSVAFERGARIIKEEMERSLPVVEFDWFKFEKWELVEKAEFIMGEEQRIETYPTFGGEGTPPEGITGILQKRDKGFVLVDSSTGKVKAEVTVNSYGKAITHYQSHTIPPSVPSFGIGKQDVPLLDNAVTNKTPTRLNAWIRRIPNAPGQNIVGRLPGTRKDEILFIAHADTVYEGPGANDNTASAIIMLMLVHAAAQNRNNFDHTLTFVASDGEEFGSKGAKHYAERRKQEGTMKNIRFVVNFDSLTYGPNLQIHSKEKKLKDIIRSIHHDLKIKANPKFDSSDGYVMDSDPFRPSGAKAVYANSRGYDAKTLPVYHRPADTASNVPLDCAEIGFLVFNKFIEIIDKL